MLTTLPVRVAIFLGFTCTVFPEGEIEWISNNFAESNRMVCEAYVVFTQR